MKPTTYTVQSICRCMLVFGQIPVRDLTHLTEQFSGNAQMAIDIADRVGATIVIGEPEDLAELRNTDLPVSVKRAAESLAATRRGLDKVANWLRTGERGDSSNAMCKRIFGLPEDAGDDHPHDPSDLLRCLQFLQATQAQDKLALMAGVSREWASLVQRWDALTALVDEEMRTGESAPQTYALMREALGD